MLMPAGNLFHIDFGYVFGQDPKPMAPPFRFTREMVDAMGGVGSEHYVLFKKYCCQVSASRGYFIGKTHTIYVLCFILKIYIQWPARCTGKVCRCVLIVLNLYRPRLVVSQNLMI
ncbi:unnamed protein product [Discosporangium mesarthrocarpum]